MRTRQKPQIIDITKSFEVIDPNTFVESMVSTEREDGEEKVISVVAYEGYNFLATPYGYKSFFGTNAQLGTAVLPNRTQFVVPIESTDGKIYFIALHEAGISFLDTSVGSTWNSIWTLAFDPEVFREWTYCFIESDLYCYAAGKNKVLKITPAGVLTEISPSFLNMAGQLGIFRASNRLGFWDSAGSVSWSSSLDFSDFTPSIENMAGNRIFSDVIGNIVAIKERGDGFVIYATSSMVDVTESEDASQVWSGKSISSTAGINNPRSVCFGTSTEEHYSYTSIGFVCLNLKGFSVVFNEIYDLLKEDRLPVYLDCINSRYLFIQVFDGKYLYGTLTSSVINVDPMKVSVKLANEYWDGDINLLPIKLDGNTIKTIIEQWRQGNYKRTVDSSDVCVTR